MKPWFYASLALNFALLAFSGYRSTQNPPLPEPTQVKLLPAKPATKPAATPKPFHWSQIESEDFPVYVANLRSVGCPESTIHDIVAAEVKEIYNEKRRAVAAAPATRRAIEVEYAKLAQEESAVVAGVVGGGPASAGTLGGPSPAVARAPRIVYPTIFQNPGGLIAQNAESSAAPKASGSPGTAAAPQPVLTPAQAEAVHQLQQQFVDAIGGPNQNPSDPAYLNRWQSAQQASDDSLRAQIGWAAFSDYRLALAKQARAGVKP